MFQGPNDPREKPCGIGEEEEEEDQREWDGDEAAGEPLSGQAASPRCLTGGGGGGGGGGILWVGGGGKRPGGGDRGFHFIKECGFSIVFLVFLG